MCNLNSIEFVLIDLKFNLFRLIGETSLNGFCLRIKLCRTRIHHNKGFMKTSNFSSLFCRKPESPKSRGPRPIVEARDGTPQKKKQCNCKHSRCLKL